MKLGRSHKARNHMFMTLRTEQNRKLKKIYLTFREYERWLFSGIKDLKKLTICFKRGHKFIFNRHSEILRIDMISVICFKKIWC